MKSLGAVLLGEVCAENVLLSWPDSSPKAMDLLREAGGPVLVGWTWSDCQGMHWHRTWRGRSDVLWMLTEKMAQDMGRFCLSQWDEWLFPERNERHWTPDLKKVELGAFFCLCDLDYPVLLSIKQGPRASGCTNCNLGLLWALLASYTSFLRETVS